MIKEQIREQIKDLFSHNILAPKYHSATFFLYENGSILAVLEETEMVRLFGNYKTDHIQEKNHPSRSLPVVQTDSVEIHLIPPNVLWYDADEIEYVGFTDTAPMGSETVEGFFTWCIGYSIETGRIYVDIGYSEEIGRYSVLTPDEEFEGRGYRDIPVKVPAYITDLLIVMSMEKDRGFYNSFEAKSLEREEKE